MGRGRTENLVMFTVQRLTTRLRLNHGTVDCFPSPIPHYYTILLKAADSSSFYTVDHVWLSEKITRHTKRQSTQSEGTELDMPQMLK